RFHALLLNGEHRGHVTQAGTLLVDRPDEIEPRAEGAHGDEQGGGNDREHSAKTIAERNHGCNPLCGKTNLTPRPRSNSNSSAKEIGRMKRGNCPVASHGPGG